MTELVKIENGVITDIILVDEDNIPVHLKDWEPADGRGIGYSIKKGKWSAPEGPSASAQECRDQRNALLFNSDWTQLPDSPADSQAWAAYRKQLRDLPKQDGFPTKINWPSQPEKQDE